MFIKLSLTQFLLIYAYANPTNNKIKNLCDSFGDRLDKELKTRDSSQLDATIGEFPSVVGIHYNDGHFNCTGVLISNQFVITSAHCLLNNTDFVRLGRVMNISIIINSIQFNFLYF